MKTAVNTCKICDEQFTYEIKKGRAPSICKKPECIRENRRLTRKPKPKVVREQKCADWDVMITQAG